VTPPTRTDIEAVVDPEIIAADEKLATAEREFEDVSVKGDSKAFASAKRRLVAAREAAQRARAAARGRARRAEEAAAREQERRAAAKRAEFYEWTAEWLRRAWPVLVLRAQLEEAEGRLKELGRQPNPGGPGDFERWRNIELWAELPEPERTVAHYIPSTPTATHDPTIDKIERGNGASPGNPRIVERVSGEDRFERVAQAIDELADREREGASS